MTGRLTLGYREAVALTDSAPFAAGQRVAGHEFHHCAVTPRAGAAPAWGWRGAEPEGFVAGGVHASFLHTHPAGPRQPSDASPASRGPGPDSSSAGGRRSSGSYREAAPQP